MVKVVVMGAPRSSTTLLLKLCNDHPEVAPLCGEVFNPDVFTWATPVAEDLRGWYRDICGVKKFGWNNFEKEKLQLCRFVKALLNKYNGFKVVYDQLLRSSKVWHFIRSRKVKVVHTHRWNVLERAVSQMLANQNKVWHVKADVPPPEDEPIEIDPRLLDRMMGGLYLDDCFYSVAFNSRTNPNVLDIHYDEVFEWDTLVEKIQDFLGVQRQKIEPFYQKRTTASIRDLVTNYQSLKRHFRNTLWSQYFVH